MYLLVIDRDHKVKYCLPGDWDSTLLCLQGQVVLEMLKSKRERESQRGFWIERVCSIDRGDENVGQWASAPAGILMNVTVVPYRVLSFCVCVQSPSGVTSSSPSFACRLVFSVTLSNLIFSFCVFPCILVSSIKQQWIFGSIWCYVNAFFTILVYTTSFFFFSLYIVPFITCRSSSDPISNRWRSPAPPPWQPSLLIGKPRADPSFLYYFCIMKGFVHVWGFLYCGIESCRSDGRALRCRDPSWSGGVTSHVPSHQSIQGDQQIEPHTHAHAQLLF